MKKEAEFTLAVGPKKYVETVYKKMQINDLHFYPNNPRISSIIIDIDKDILTDDLLYDLMRTRQSEVTKSLYQEVKKDGQINEPLIVYQNEVLEGNTRLWVAKTLYIDTGASDQWKLVPCRVIQGVLDTKEIDYILCNCHIRTKRDWMPFEQACYFYRMNAEESRSIKEIAELTSTNQTKINDYIATFKEMKIRKADRNQFSHYYETIRQPEVKKAERRGVPVIDIIQRELKKDRITDAKHVRKLTNILQDDIATKKLIEEDADIYRAEKIAVTRNPEQDDEFLKNLVEVTDMIENVEHEKIKSLQDNPRKLEIVKNFIQAVTDFSKFISH
jgi:hypothetical protein